MDLGTSIKMVQNSFTNEPSPEACQLTAVGTRVLADVHRCSSWFHLCLIGGRWKDLADLRRPSTGQFVDPRVWARVVRLDCTMVLSPEGKEVRV